MKFMNMKRFASTVMAGVLTLSLAVPAFAADTQPKNSTVVNGTYKEIPIAVEVPTTGTAQINPYGLPVTITKSDDKTVSLVGQKITTQPLNIKNQGTTALDVNASLAVAPKGGVAIVADVDNTTTGKEVKVVLEVAAMNDTTLAVSSDSETLGNLLIYRFDNEASWEDATTLDAPVAAKDTAAADITPAASNATMAVLGAVTPKAEGFTYAKNSIALFRLTGDLNAEPTKTDAGTTVSDPWVDADGFSATVIFKFTPHQNVDASISLDKSTSALSSGSETLTASFDAGDTELTVTSWAWTTSDATVANTNASNTTNTATVAYVGAGNATITVTATLSDNTTRTAVCAYTNT